MGEPVPPHWQPANAELGYGAGAFPLTEAMHREVLSVPMGPQLEPGQQDRVLHAARCAAPPGTP